MIVTVMFPRVLEGHLPRHSFFLFGPRQVGKSTLLSSLKTLFSVDLLDPARQLEYSKDPSILDRQLKTGPQEGFVLIDEIQKVPSLLDVIHSLMEKHPKLRFAMSGSSARKLRHGAANLLGGRALYRTLHPLAVSEIGEKFRLDWALGFGTLPKIYSLLIDGEIDTARDRLRSYVITYLAEEIKAEALVRNLQGFQNFLDVAAAQFAEQVNFTDVGRECRVAYATVREYYSILEDTLMGIVLPPYSRSIRKRMSLAPKFYFFDCGVTRAILGTLGSEPGPIEKGRLFEQWFVQEVYRLNEYHQKDWKLSFWRTSHGAEVDLLIERGRRLLCGIECKYKRGISGRDLSGIHSLREMDAKLPCFIVSPSDTPQEIDGVLVASPRRILEKLTTEF